LNLPGPKICGNPQKPVKPLYRIPKGIELSHKVLQWPHPQGPDPGTGKPRVICIFEFRAGAIQDILPPSLHPGVGQPYVWHIPPWEAELPELPPELLELRQHWEEYAWDMRAACPWAKPEPRPKPKAAPRKVWDLHSVSVIDAWNSTCDICELLEAHGYKKRGQRYLAPGSSTKIPGVVVFENGRVYSHHGSDLLAGGHSHDAFDVYRILEHSGDTRAAVKAAAEALGMKRPLSERLKQKLKRTADQSAEAEGDDWPRLQPYDHAAALDSDRANAVRIAQHFGVCLLHVEHIGWHTWQGTHWRRSDEEALRIAAQLSRIILKEAAQCADDASQQEAAEKREALTKKAEKLSAWALKSESRWRIEAVLELARALLNVRTEELDHDLYALNVKNGVIDLRTGMLRPHKRADFATHCCPVAYDPEAKAPMWEAFLRRIFADDADIIGFMQRAVGYSLTGDTGEQCLFIPYGTGANGKSVFLFVIGRLLAGYAKQAAPDLLLAKNQDRHPTEIADLFGARLVTAVETGKGRRLAENLVKQMTGGDRMKGRFMRQDFFEFDATYKLWLATNHKPKICGTDYAIWRRIRLIPFEVTIPEDERDPKLAARLIAEELSGILAWTVQGCLAWQEKGLKPPEKVRAATEAYRKEMDVLAGFLEECCLVSKSAEARASALYKAYEGWCEENEESPETQNEFGSRLTERGLTRFKRNGRCWWRGIGLLASVDLVDLVDLNSDLLQERGNSEFIRENGLQGLQGLQTCPHCDDGEGYH